MKKYSASVKYINDKNWKLLKRNTRTLNYVMFAGCPEQTANQYSIIFQADTIAPKPTKFTSFLFIADYYLVIKF